MTQALADFIDTIFGFRKFIIMVGLFAVGIVFRMKGLVNGQEFVDLMKATVIGFFSANSVEHFSIMAKSFIQGKVLNKVNPRVEAAAVNDASTEASQEAEEAK